MSNRIKKRTSIVLGVFLCAAVAALGQSLCPTKAGMGKNSAPIGVPGEGTQEIAVRVAAEKARETKIYNLDEEALAAMDAGRYAEAEMAARQSVSLSPSSGRGLELLAAILDAQGKTQKALQAYKEIANMGDVIPRNELPYALLLLKTGHWAQAVATYNKQLPYLADGDLIVANSHFSSDVPQPGELATAIHIGLGLTSSWRGYHGTDQSRNQQSLAQFQQALALEPDSALAHLYYARKLQHLGRSAEAQAAFSKAAELGNRAVKAAAEQELR